MIKLRWLVTCDVYGRKSAPCLQYLDDWKGWCDVEFIELKLNEDGSINEPGEAG